MRRESEVERFAASRGYAAIPPLATEDATAPLGLPFTIKPYAGMTALDVVKTRPWRMRAVLSSVGELHARAHALPLDGCPIAGDGEFTARAFDGATEYLDRVAPGAFERELQWLKQRRDRVQHAALSLLHNDFHPLNVLVDADGVMRVIDWTDAAIAIGTTTWGARWRCSGSPGLPLRAASNERL
jgi:aminoglycoside phosphotransferase (APT) family kinase protein